MGGRFDFVVQRFCCGADTPSPPLLASLCQQHGALSLSIVHFA